MRINQRLRLPSFLCAITALSLACTDSKQLSRDFAKSLIEKHGGFRQVEFSVPSRTDYVDGEITRLRDKKVLSFTMVQRGIFQTIYTVVPTETAKQYILRKDGETIVFQACERRVVDVTGIELREGTGAVAHFTYRIENTTPYSDQLAICIAQPNSAGIAAFQRFDDGWRLRDVSPPSFR